MARFPHRATLGEVASDLQSAFDRAGYVEKSYYGVPEGFAVVSRLEQIDADGRPFPGNARWQIADYGPFSLSTYIQRLFAVDEGHFRVVVFIVTSEPFAASNAAVDVKLAEDWLLSGDNLLPPSIGSLKVSNDVACTALVYEFRRRHGEQPEFVLPSLISAQQHLVASGLKAALEGQSAQGAPE